MSALTKNAESTSILFLFCLLMIPVARGGDTCNDAGISRQMEQTISHRYPLLKIVELSQLSQRHQDLWIRKYDRQCPGVAKGKFIPNANESFAVLLKKEQNGEAYLRVVLLVPTVRRHEMLEVGPQSGAEGDNVLTRAKPGRYTGVDGKAVDIKFDGIVLEQLESGSVLFYWCNKKFHSLVLSE